MWRILKQILIDLFWGLLDFALFFWVLNYILIPYKPNDFTVTNSLPTDRIIVTTTNRPIEHVAKPAKNAKNGSAKPKATNKAKQSVKTKVPPANKTEKQALKTAKQFWFKQLGFDPFWDIPIYWHTELKSDNEHLQPLGVTKTLVGNFPLTANHKVAYMQIDDQAAKKQHVDLAKVLAHEWGHALGLKHGYGIMEPLATNMTWKVNKAQKEQITQNYKAGH